MNISYSSIKVSRRTLDYPHDYTIIISKNLFKKLGMDDSSIKLAAGKKKTAVHIYTEESADDEVQLSDDLLISLSMPIKDRRFLLRYSTEQKTLYIGPIIGILTSIYINPSGEPDFRSIHTFCEELNKGIEDLGGLIYIFSLNGVSEQEVIGYFYEESTWRKAKLPFPDAIYNRIHSRRLEFEKDFKSLVQQADIHKTSLFNFRFLSKAEVHSYLRLEEHLQPYLPEAELFSKEALISLLQKFGEVYVKPIHGSQGRNIIRISRNDQLYILQFSSQQQKEPLCYSTLDKLAEDVTAKIKQKSFIIQQGIRLVEPDNRKIDFRVLCHKNKQNLWRTTSVVARLSGEAEFVSNIARGGEIIRPLKALSQMFDLETARQQLAQMKELSAEIAESIDRQAEGLVVELGIDMGVDEDGRLWLIEVNSKPSKNFEDKSNTIRPSAKAIIEYCTGQYLKR